MAGCAGLDASCENSLSGSENYHTAETRAFFTHEACSNFLPRPQYTEQLHRHFAEATRYSSLARCVLWGRAGAGKRQLAIDFAIEYGRQSGRKVLWVDGAGTKSFLRDYRQAYFTLTRTRVLPNSSYGLNLHYSLSSIRRTLEERHEEWLLVLLGVVDAIEAPDANASGCCFADYLPSRGQTLVTTSSVHGEHVSDNEEEERIWMGLKLPHTLAVHVKDLEQHELDQYYESQCGGSKDDLEHIDCHELFGLGFPRLTLSFSHMRWLRLDPRRYRSYMLPFFKDANGAERDAVPRGISPRLPETLEAVWTTVKEVDNTASRLLLYISLFGSARLPWCLLQQLQELKEIDSSELYESRKLLATLGLITVHTSGLEEEEQISTHHLIRQWIHNKMRVMYDGEDEYKDAIYQVVDLLANQFTVEDVVKDSERFWNLIGHYWPIARMATKYRLGSSSCVALFSHIAMFFLSEGTFVSGAERFINQAISTATLVERVSKEQDHGGHCLSSMCETRARILLYLARPREAKAEVKRAFAHTKTFPVNEDEKMLIRQRLRDIEAEASFLDDDCDAAIKILSVDLMQESLSEFERANKHHWMAKCMIGSGYLSSALGHSHMAISCWNRSPDKWKQTKMLRWVDWHTLILIRAGKFKAAAMFLPNLIDEYLSSIPPTAQETWRAAYSLSKTHPSISDHEALAIKMLSAAKVDQLRGNSLTYCLMILHDLACHLQSRGRLIEAEAIFRHNIDVAAYRNPPDLGDGEPYDYSQDRLKLLLCLYEQGRRSEARAMRRLFKTDYGDDMTLLRERFDDYWEFLQAYREALQLRMAGEDEKLLSCCSRQLEHGIYRYGCLENRLHEYGDPMYDIDHTGVGMARKSQVLHLLEYDLVHLGFFDRYGKSDDIWAPEGQRVLGEYFSFCECRRHRKRSGSLNPVDLIEGHFLREITKKETKIKLNTTQPSIIKWLRNLRHAKSHDYTGEPLSEQEIKAFVAKRPNSPDPDHHCRSPNHCVSTYVSSRQIHWNSNYWTGTDMVHLTDETGEVTWKPFFLQFKNHELDLEQLAVPNALNIPYIRITGADGEPAGPKMKDVSKEKLQMEIPSYFMKARDSFAGHPILPKLDRIKEEEQNE